MPRCAKSWQTPRRFSKTSSSGVATVVALGSYLKSVKIRRVKSRAPAEQRRVRGETLPGVIRQFKRRAHLRRIKNKLIRLDHLRRNRVAEQVARPASQDGEASSAGGLTGAHGHPAVR